MKVEGGGHRGMTLVDLEQVCAEIGKDYDAALRMVRRLNDGVDREEAVAIVVRLLRGGNVTQTQGASTVENALAAIDARRREVADRLEGIDKEKTELKAEEKKLNKAAQALRSVTGTENREFFCDECNLPFASRQGLSTHKTKTHRKAS